MSIMALQAMLHTAMSFAAISKGLMKSIDTAGAKAAPGVIAARQAAFSIPRRPGVR